MYIAGWWSGCRVSCVQRSLYPTPPSTHFGFVVPGSCAMRAACWVCVVVRARVYNVSDTSLTYESRIGGRDVGCVLGRFCRARNQDEIVGRREVEVHHQ